MAAFLVFAFHISIIDFYDEPAVGVVKGIFGAGSVGVSFFFILSGFILMWVSTSSYAWRTFWLRRFARVYPLHLVTALLAVASLALLTNAVFPTTDTALLNLLLLHAWSPNVEHFQSLNKVSWTLSCEAFFYFVFPIIGSALRRLSAAQVRATVIASLAAVVLGPALGAVILPVERAEWYFHWTPMGRLPEFILGVALCRLVMIDAWPSRAQILTRMPAALTILGAGYVITPMAPPVMRPAACTALGFALLIVAAVRSDLTMRSSWVRSSFMVRLGELSFAFYLVHMLAIRVLEFYVGWHPKLDLTAASVATLLAFGMSLTAAWLLNVYIEKPARSFLVQRTGDRAGTSKPTGPRGNHSDPHRAQLRRAGDAACRKRIGDAGARVGRRL